MSIRYEGAPHLFQKRVLSLNALVFARWSSQKKTWSSRKNIHCHLSTMHENMMWRNTYSDAVWKHATYNVRYIETCIYYEYLVENIFFSELTESGRDDNDDWCSSGCFHSCVYPRNTLCFDLLLGIQLHPVFLPFFLSEKAFSRRATISPHRCSKTIY